jgi:hypothetical protein
MSLILDSLRPDDANEMLRLARETGQATHGWVYSPGAAGTVVRDGDKIRGFCLLRETGVGFVVDELWCEREDHQPTRDGKASIVLLAKWLEETVQTLANERGCSLQLGGIVRLDNPTHRAALEHRGFVPVATVLTKEFTPWA